MTQWLVPPGQQRQPGLGGQLAGKAAEKIAAEQVAKLGLTAAGNAAAGPIGGAVAGAAGDLVAPLAGQLVGQLFEHGGKVHKKKKGSIWDSIKDAASYAWKNDNTLQARAKKPQYKAIGGLTPGPLGMSDLMMAGKDKDISKVKLKKNKGDMSEEVEYTYHAPLAAKPNPGE